MAAGSTGEGGARSSDARLLLIERLIKHADGWVTAYGHLSRVDVRMQQKVTQGQQIGQAGSTGGVTEPQLHFEVRYAPTPQERARPVDPAPVLPKMAKCLRTMSSTSI